MHVCKIPSLTKRKSFEGYKENIEVLEAYINAGLWYLKGVKFELVGYSDSNYAGCNVERSKIVLHYQPLEPNTYPPVVVEHKFFE